MCKNKVLIFLAILCSIQLNSNEVAAQQKSSSPTAQQNQLDLLKTIFLPRVNNPKLDALVNKLSGIKTSKINETLNNGLFKEYADRVRNKSLPNKELIEKTLSNETLTEIKQKGNEIFNQNIE